MAKKYLVIYYRQDNNEELTIHLWPCKSEEDCHRKLSKVLDTKFGPRVVEFDIIESQEKLEVIRDILDTKKKRKKRLDAGISKKKPQQESEQPKIPKFKKDDLRKILADRGIKTLYHDTMDILIQKYLDSEEKGDKK